MAYRRLQLFIATSLDGCIAGPGGDLSWLFHDADYGYTPFYERIDTVLMGRRTYETALSFAQWPYAGRKAIVFTRSGERVVASPDTIATSRSPSEIVGELRQREGKLLWLVGGGEIVRACLDAGLIDDVVVSIHPVILGNGTPLFPPGTRRTDLVLTAERRYPSGVVRLVYRVEPTADSAARPA
jgi:dihydrofolate reductase